MFMIIVLLNWTIMFGKGEILQYWKDFCAWVFFLGEGGAGAKRNLTVLTETTTVFIKSMAVKIILLVSPKFLVSAQVAGKPFFLSLSSSF